jgi:hypothetical protein
MAEIVADQITRNAGQRQGKPKGAASFVAMAATEALTGDAFASGFVGAGGWATDSDGINVEDFATANLSFDWGKGDESAFEFLVLTSRDGGTTWTVGTIRQPFDNAAGYSEASLDVTYIPAAVNIVDEIGFTLDVRDITHIRAFARAPDGTPSGTLGLNISLGI